MNDGFFLYLNISHLKIITNNSGGTKNFFVGLGGTCNKFYNLDLGIWVPRKAWAGPGSMTTEGNLELAGCAGRQRHTERQGLEGWFLQQQQKEAVYFYR